MLDNRVIPLKRGFVAVINRGQKDIDDGVSIRQARITVIDPPTAISAADSSCLLFPVFCGASYSHNDPNTAAHPATSPRHELRIQNLPSPLPPFSLSHSFFVCCHLSFCLRVVWWVLCHGRRLFERKRLFSETIRPTEPWKSAWGRPICQKRSTRSVSQQLLYSMHIFCNIKCHTPPRVKRQRFRHLKIYMYIYIYYLFFF